MHLNGHLTLDVQSVSYQLDHHRMLVHLFQETVTEVVVDFVEASDNAFRYVLMKIFHEIEKILETLHRSDFH